MLAIFAGLQLPLLVLLVAAPEAGALRAHGGHARKSLHGSVSTEVSATQDVSSALNIVGANSTGTAASLVSEGKIAPQTMSAANVFLEAFTVMTAAEMFDRTWFMTLICSLKYGWELAFLGSVLALAVHAVLAVSFGALIAGMLPKLALEFLSGALFGCFALLYASNALQADKEEDSFESNRREAEDAVNETLLPKEDLGIPAGKAAPVAPSAVWGPLGSVFVAIFVAEWGDRTQLVMAGLAASLPALPVLMGAFCALIVLCFSAVALGRMFEGTRVDDRMVNGLCALSFGVISVLALVAATREALIEYGVV